MSQKFLECVKNGGRTRTINLKPGKYMHVCFINGKSYSGEVHKTKEKSEKRRVLKGLARNLLGLQPSR